MKLEDLNKPLRFPFRRNPFVFLPAVVVSVPTGVLLHQVYREIAAQRVKGTVIDPSEAVQTPIRYRDRQRFTVIGVRYEVRGRTYTARLADGADPLAARLGETMTLSVMSGEPDAPWKPPQGVVDVIPGALFIAVWVGACGFFFWRGWKEWTKPKPDQS